MANHEIIEANPIMLAINLDRPFPLGFGTLESLPRVLLQIKTLEEGKLVEGIGEASIDFPFSHYDAWDIFWTLTNSNLQGRSLESQILSDEKLKSFVLGNCPAAFTAINMALDDVLGKINGESILAVGMVRTGGKALASIAFQDETARLLSEIEGKFNQGFVPKPKVGRGKEQDFATIRAVSKIAADRQIPFVLDFNAQYYPEDFAKLIASLKGSKIDLSQLIFLEQPTSEDAGIEGLVYAKNVLEEHGYNIPIIADESFVTMVDAIKCACFGIALNYKIHKVGGRYQAKVIEDAVMNVNGKNQVSMVGGTFPTAIGRVYDQQVASILETATLPGDGWEPSTDWFTGAKHIIYESFNFDTIEQHFKPIKGPGLGITPDWEKINKFRIKNPQDEYRKLRAGKNGKHLKIELKRGQVYSTVYAKRSGKAPDWNL